MYDFVVPRNGWPGKGNLQLYWNRGGDTHTSGWNVCENLFPLFV